MKVITINKKNFPVNVLKMKVGDMDSEKFSEKFKVHNLSPETEVYVKCDEDGTIQYRGNKGEYRIFEVGKWEEIN